MMDEELRKILSFNIRYRLLSPSKSDNNVVWTDENLNARTDKKLEGRAVKRYNNKLKKHKLARGMHCRLYYCKRDVQKLIPTSIILYSNCTHTNMYSAGGDCLAEVGATDVLPVRTILQVSAEALLLRCEDGAAQCRRSIAVYDGWIASLKQLRLAIQLRHHPAQRHHHYERHAHHHHRRSSHDLRCSRLISKHNVL